ncbi:CAP domain-containing protein [Jeotgalibacillus soli]|uniref:Serine protease n=1 Tax=Jeotgalibacillus soli TaxID=889306 RepID=A0A0C2VIK0_9BACL|nr:CAP domain-containing protein [Jeotgalibacillus soli]KIL43833.1 hypothetical protein KP78_36570 [Jeotgalibacillus soli]
MLRRLFLFILLLVGVFISRPMWEGYLNDYVDLSFMDSISSSVDSVKENPAVIVAIDTAQDTLHSLFVQIDQAIEQTPVLQTQESEEIERPDLSPPTDQTFSVYNIQVGDSKEHVEQQLGEPVRQSQNEYGVDWYTYHENYQNFMMVSYDEGNLVNGLYTNQELISSSVGIELNSSKEAVREQLGEPLTGIRKGMIVYQIQSNEEYDVYQLDGSYATIFYDIHEENSVTALQIISEELEKNKNHLYAEESRALKEGFEYQLFDFTNASRVNHGLPILNWDDHVRETAREHSLDMAENLYFDHTNLEGQSPFDRMEEDGVRFTVAGENLAYGQSSSIFAHEGLMNSLGHRENILKSDFRFLGIGVAFNAESQPYYTENFYNQ